MQGLSERQYAARVGLSRGAIQKAKDTGRLVLHADGSIDAEASDSRDIAPMINRRRMSDYPALEMRPRRS